MKFLTSKDVKLINGGYLVDSKNTPIVNEDFVAAQKRAEYMIELSKNIKDKNFSEKPVDSITKAIEEVAEKIKEKNVHIYKTIDEPKKSKLIQQLQEEASSFIYYEKNKLKADKLNNNMQEFNALKQFEEFGLYFNEGIIVLNQLYTINEIQEAAEIYLEKLNKI